MLLSGFRLPIPMLVLAVAGATVVSVSRGELSHPANAVSSLDRSPVDLVLTADEQWLLAANQTSGKVTLFNMATGRVASEVPCGQRPSSLCLSPDGRRVLVAATMSGELAIFTLIGTTLKPEGRMQLGFEPRGLAVSPDGKQAYVSLTTAHQVAVVDLEKSKVIERIPVGRWPRYLALTGDGRRLADGPQLA